MYCMYVRQEGLHEQTSSPPAPPSYLPDLPHTPQHTPPPPGAADIKGSVFPYTLGENKTRWQQDVAENFQAFSNALFKKKKKKEKEGERTVGDYLTPGGKISPLKSGLDLHGCLRGKILTNLKEIKHTKDGGSRRVCYKFHRMYIQCKGTT